MDNKIKKIINVVSKCLNLKEGDLDFNSSRKNIKKWDSLNQVKIMIQIEKNFNVKINPKDYEKITSIKNIPSVQLF